MQKQQQIDVKWVQREARKVESEQKWPQRDAKQSQNVKNFKGDTKNLTEN